MYNIPNFYSFLNSPAKNPARNSPKEISGANGKFLPKPLLFHLRHPNSKTNQPKFWQILSPKNSFAKTSSALFRHLPEYLEGRTPKKNVLSTFKKKFTPAKSKKQETFFFGVAGVLASAWGFLRIICFGNRFELGTINTQIRKTGITPVFRILYIGLEPRAAGSKEEPKVSSYSNNERRIL